MFGISFTEIALIAMVALIVVGPQKLPAMLRSLGQWVGRLRRLTSEVRAQTGIDDILREEGIDGVRELRSLLRGEIQAAKHRQLPLDERVEFDLMQEYPPEGADARGALPDDLVDLAEGDLAEGDLAEGDLLDDQTTAVPPVATTPGPRVASPAPGVPVVPPPKAPLAPPAPGASSRPPAPTTSSPAARPPRAPVPPPKVPHREATSPSPGDPSERPGGGKS